MVGDAEVGVDQILNRLDGARIAQFVHFHPNAVFHHFVENMERFRLLRVRFPSAIFHDMKHFVVACIVIFFDMLLNL